MAFFNVKIVIVGRIVVVFIRIKGTFGASHKLEVNLPFQKVRNCVG